MPRGDGPGPSGGQPSLNRERRRNGGLREGKWVAPGQRRTRSRMHLSRMRNDYSSQSRDALSLREMPTMRFTDGKKIGDIYSEGGSNE